MVDTIPVMTTGRDVVLDPLEVGADVVDVNGRGAVFVKLYAEDSLGDPVPVVLGDGGTIATTPQSTVVIDDVADETILTGNSLTVGPFDILSYKSIAGHLIADQVVTYTMKFGRLNTLLANKTTSEAVTPSANEPVEIRESTFLGQYFAIVISNSSGSTATISGQILGFPA